MAFPTVLDTFVNRTNKTGSADTSDTSFILASGSLSGYGYYNDILATLTALEAKLGINASAVTTSIDYLLKNSASVNPGHLHTGLWAPNGSRVEIQTDNNGNGNVTLNGTRFQCAIGAAVASANNLTLGLDGNWFPMTGTTQINLIDTTNWQGGSVITLRFSGSLTVKHNQAPSGNFKAILLNGNVDFVATAPATLTLGLDNGTWYEVGRKA